MSIIKLVQNVGHKTNMTQKEVSPIVKAVFECIQESLEKGETTTILGFGKFEVVTKPERMGRNPKTGDTIKIPAHERPVFKMSTQLVDSVKATSPKPKKAKKK